MSRAELGKPREAGSSKVGLPTNPDSGFSPAVRAAAAGPLGQTQRGEKRRKGKKPAPIPWETHVKTTSHGTRNVCEAPGSG